MAQRQASIVKRFRQIIEKYATGKTVLVLFVLTNLVYAFMLTVTIPKVMAHAHGMPLLDMMPTGYDVPYVKTLMETLGEPGRAAYGSVQIPVDMIYPMLFGVGYGLLMAYLLLRLGKFRSAYSYLCLLPPLAGVADYAENFGILALLQGYPDIATTTVRLTNAFSLVKSGATTLYFVALIGALIALGIRFIQKRQGKAPRA